LLAHLTAVRRAVHDTVNRARTTTGSTPAPRQHTAGGGYLGGVADVV
jgi:hypothetical protein